MYEIEYVEGVADDLKKLGVGQRKRILDSIDENLKYEPTRQTRNRKILVGLIPPWEYIEPVWELRVGKYRFSMMSTKASAVIVRAIRHKPPHKTTEETL